MQYEPTAAEVAAHIAKLLAGSASITILAICAYILWGITP
jgi:hypothetical protein